jgi:hypothetical protein
MPGFLFYIAGSFTQLVKQVFLPAFLEAIRC